MEEFLAKLKELKYNLNLENLENFNIDNKVEEIEKIEEEISQRKKNLEDLSLKIQDLDNYKKNGQELFDMESRKNILSLIRTAELNVNSNDHRINSLTIESKYAENEEIKKLKEDELNIALSEKNELLRISEDYKKMLDNFDNNKNNQEDLYVEELSNDEMELYINKEEIKKLENRKSILIYDFRKELDTLIEKIENKSISLDEGKQIFDEFTQHIDKEFFINDFIDRDTELLKNQEMQDILNIQIKDLQEKLNDEKNYKRSLFVVERNEDLVNKWENKKNNIVNDIEKYNLENLKIDKDKIEYEEIINLCRQENLELRKSLRREGNKDLESKLDMNYTLIREAEDCLYELEIEKKDNETILSNLNSKKDRTVILYNNLDKRMSNNEIDKSEIRLDEIKLSNMVSDLNSLKNRQKYLSKDIQENINEINLIDKEKEEEKEVREIVSIKRPNKSKIIEKIKKIAKVVLASMATAVLVSNFTPKDSELSTDNLSNDLVIDNIVNELDDNLIENEDQFELEDLNEINLSDYITLNEDAAIYKNQYDSSNKANAYNPRYDRNIPREVIGISVISSEGVIEFIQDEDLLKEKIENGYEVDSYLTSMNNEPEGFWNADDAVKDKTIDLQIEEARTR